tara:strand:+ start:131 stop:1003 length:873 start_codon:yes stop_codon:yes gene_type:complete
MENMNLKEQLTKICEDIIKENNKDFNHIEYEATGISNHILNEKGVQMKIGLELIKKLKLHNKLQFEKKIINNELQKKDYLDVFLFHNNKKIGIELKFKTKAIDGTFFSNQGAETNGQHSFFWDLHRLNDLVDREEIHEGYQIFITNDSSYWKEKKSNLTKYLIKIKKDTGKPYIYTSKEKEQNNSDKFNMTDLTQFKKDGMPPPNWTSVDKIAGQKAKDPLKMLRENLNKKVEENKLLYCKEEIKLKHVIDEHILWKRDLTESQIKSSKSPKTKKVSKFAFIIVELKKGK